MIFIREELKHGFVKAAISGAVTLTIIHFTVFDAVGKENDNKQLLESQMVVAGQLAYKHCQKTWAMMKQIQLAVRVGLKHGSSTLQNRCRNHCTMLQ